MTPMRKRLYKTEKQILDNLDRLLAGQMLHPPESFLEEKILQALKRAETSSEQLARQQESTARLLSDLSHQLKTPLSALSLHLELAGDPSLTPEEQEEALRESRLQAEKIRFLSNAMFKVSRLESGLIAVRKHPADLCDTVRKAAETVRPAALEKGLAFALSLPESAVLPHDPVWTREALVNLLDNAVKYTSDGGVTVQLEKGAVFTRIDVRDTGPGLAPEEYARVFSRFYRGKTGQAEGTGLGLSIAREILRRQDGNITVQSDGKGCTFSLFLQNC